MSKTQPTSATSERHDQIYIIFLLQFNHEQVVYVVTTFPIRFVTVLQEVPLFPGL